MKGLLFSLLLISSFVLRANIGQREYAEFVRRPLLVVLDKEDTTVKDNQEYNDAVVKNNALIKQLMPVYWQIKNPSIQYAYLDEASELVKANPNKYSVLAFGKYGVTTAAQTKNVMALRAKLVGDDLKKSLQHETKYDILSYVFGQWPADPGVRREKDASMLSVAVLSSEVTPIALERALHMFDRYITPLADGKSITDIVNPTANYAKLKTKQLLIPAEYLEIAPSAVAKDYPNRYDVLSREEIEKKIKAKVKGSAYIDFMFSDRLHREIFIIVDCETGDILASCPMNTNPSTGYMAAVQALIGWHFKAFMNESEQLYFF